MPLPNTPLRWAGRISQIHKAYCTSHGSQRFPINVEGLAIQVSQQFFPDEPITDIIPKEYDSIEGALFSKENKTKWGICYNSAISNEGRINFTIAHELGHYLLHRKIIDNIECQRNTLESFNGSNDQIEIDANIFACNLLMPKEDMAKILLASEPTTSDTLKCLASRYNVSLSAICIQSIQVVTKPSIVVSCIDGFMNWSCSNQKAMAAGFFFPTRQKTIKLPKKSLASNMGSKITMATHPPGVWHPEYKTEEILIYNNDEYTLSLVNLIT
jgi:Zn-dependent peptidase ImmA (M78 family)